MDEDQARELAAAVISNWQAEVDRIDATRRDANLPTSDTDTEYIITQVTRISRTWCVFNNNRRYIETGEISHQPGEQVAEREGRAGRARRHGDRRVGIASDRDGLAVLGDVLAYREITAEKRRVALDEMAREAEELGLYD